jgi:MFS transporter, DHA2 family, multidrug resistance protein
VKGIFKEWVPEWLIKLILFSSLMPSMVLFFLPGANTNVTAGFYGAQPSDIQFLIILFYAGFVGFYVLERRFFLYFPIKQYYIIFHLLQLLNCFLMYSIRDISWVYGLRFFQGMLFASAVNLSISMIFSRLKSDRAKEVSYYVARLLIRLLRLNLSIHSILISSIYTLHYHLYRVYCSLC